MDEANEALKLSFEYANEQLTWYTHYGFWKYVLFRFVGVTAIVLTVLITYVSASTTNENLTIWRFRKNNLVAVLAAISAILISVSSFFDWRGAWESHRVAQLEIEAIIVDHQIRQQEYKKGGDEKLMFELARSLTIKVRDVVEAETKDFFSSQSKNIPNEIGRNNKEK